MAADIHRSRQTWLTNHGCHLIGDYLNKRPQPPAAGTGSKETHSPDIGVCRLNDSFKKLY